MRRYRLHALAVVLIWVGAVEVIGSFLARFLFGFPVAVTPFFFLLLLVGVGLYIAVRLL